MRQVLTDFAEEVNVGTQRLTEFHEKILRMRFQIQTSCSKKKEKKKQKQRFVSVSFRYIIIQRFVTRIDNKKPELVSSDLAICSQVYRQPQTVVGKLNLNSFPRILNVVHQFSAMWIYQNDTTLLSLLTLETIPQVSHCIHGDQNSVSYPLKALSLDRASLWSQESKEDEAQKIEYIILSMQKDTETNLRQTQMCRLSSSLLSKSQSATISFHEQKVEIKVINYTITIDGTFVSRIRRSSCPAPALEIASQSRFVRRSIIDSGRASHKAYWGQQN